MPGGGMRAALSYGRSKLWRQRYSWLGLALLVGLAGGAVLAVLAAGSRTDTAYRRFTAKYLAADVIVLPPFSPGLASLDYTKVAQLPEVTTSARVEYLGVDGGASVIVPLDDRAGRLIERSKVLSGRVPDPNRPHEAAVNFEYARRAHVHVGTTLVLRLVRPAPAGVPPEVVPFNFRVVGVVAGPGEFPPALDGYYPSDVHLSRAFSASYRGELRSFVELAVRLRHGDADVPAFEGGLQRLAGNVPFLDNRVAQQAANVQRAIHPQAVALRLLGGFLGLTAARGGDRGFRRAPAGWQIGRRRAWSQGRQGTHLTRRRSRSGTTVRRRSRPRNQDGQRPERPPRWPGPGELEIWPC
jgi:hypothetical protein